MIYLRSILIVLLISLGLAVYLQAKKVETLNQEKKDLLEEVTSAKEYDKALKSEISQFIVREKEYADAIKNSDAENNALRDRVNNGAIVYLHGACKPVPTKADPAGVVEQRAELDPLARENHLRFRAELEKLEIKLSALQDACSN